MTQVQRPVCYVRVAATLSLFVGLAACGGGGGGGTTPPTPTLASIVLASTSVTAGATVQGTATLDRAAGSGGANVSLSSSNSSIATVPATVLVPEGSQSATFTVTGVAAGGPVTITGNFGGSRTANLTVNAASIDLVSVSLSSNSVNAPGTVQGTVTISGPAPSAGTTVGLSSSNSAVTVPANVTVASGSTSANFTVNVGTAATGNVTITGTLGGTSRIANLAVGAVALEASFVVIPNPGTIATGEQCEVQSQPAPGGGSQNLLKCTFDASSSKGNITTYIWRIPQTGSVLTFTRTGDPRLSNITVNCGSFGTGNVGTAAQRDITLEVQGAGIQPNQITKSVTFIRNGPCG